MAPLRQVESSDADAGLGQVPEEIRLVSYLQHKPGTGGLSGSVKLSGSAGSGSLTYHVSRYFIFLGVAGRAGR
jgi:hypothetical protein